MNIRPIRSNTDHQKALKEIERLWNAEQGTEEFDRLDVLATLVDAYERKRWPIAKPHPIEALRFRMDQLGLSRKDLVPMFGRRSRVSEVLSGRRSLSLAMIRTLNEKLEIPAEVLIARTPKPRSRATPKQLPRKKAASRAVAAQSPVKSYERV